MLRSSFSTRRVALGIAAATALAVVACDFSVTNPGPIADDALQGSNLLQPLTRRSMTAGARRSLGDAMDVILYWGAATTFEINPAGSTGSFGIPTQVQFGNLRDDIISGEWNDAQVARWTSEEIIRRFTAAAVPEDSMFAAVYLWAGYANRLLGENFCDAIFDAGPKEDFKNFFTRAEGHFTEALRIAQGLTINATNKANVVNAAYAGRASVRMSLASYNNDAAKWAQAVADANAVTSNTFRWVMPYSDQDQDQYNYLYHARANGPYRAHTQWATYYEDYYRTTRDSRIPWDTTSLRGDAAVDKFAGYPGVSNNRVYFWPEAKHNARTSAVALSSGWEMRLIEAEAALALSNDTTTALARINTRRAALTPVQPAVNAGGTIAGAWMQLKRERMLELWLEARRLGDLRRWDVTATPGQTFDGVWVTGEGTPRETMTSPAARSLCFPIGRGETQTNPNLLGGG